MKEKALGLLLSCLGLSPGLAYGATDPCPELKSPQAVIQCALLQHPEIQKAKAQLSQAERLESAASQIPNPEIDSKGVVGTSLGDTIVTFEANLGFVLELGGKRGSRIERANAEQEQVSAEFLQAKEEVYLDTLTALIRLRQIQTEANSLDRALMTFDRVQKVYRARGKLGAEQQVSLAIFQLAEGDYRVRRNVVAVEKTSLQQRLSLALGRQFPISDELFPPVQRNWPKVEAAQDPSVLKGSGLRIAEAGLKVAEADLSLAQSESWPNLKIGPSFEQVSEGPIAYQTYGMNISLPLPLFNLNGGSRAYAHQGVSRAEVTLALQRKTLLTELEILSSQYNAALEAFQRLPSTADLERKYRDVESLFQRGLVSSSIVIEAHRQMVDFTKTQNELELSAVQALWKIYALEGRMFGENLHEQK